MLSNSENKMDPPFQFNAHAQPVATANQTRTQTRAARSPAFGDLAIETFGKETEMVDDLK